MTEKPILEVFIRPDCPAKETYVQAIIERTSREKLRLPVGDYELVIRTSNLVPEGQIIIADEGAIGLPDLTSSG